MTTLQPLKRFGVNKKELTLSYMNWIANKSEETRVFQEQIIQN
jgi:hypothetical protein